MGNTEFHCQSCIRSESGKHGPLSKMLCPGNDGSISPAPSLKQGTHRLKMESPLRQSDVSLWYLTSRNPFRGW